MRLYQLRGRGRAVAVGGGSLNPTPRNYISIVIDLVPNEVGNAVMPVFPYT